MPTVVGWWNRSPVNPSYKNTWPLIGILACLLFLFYPNKGKFVLWCIAWSVVIALIPLFYTSPDLLVWQYKNWLELLANDHSGSYGYSFMGVLHTWFGINSGKNVLVIIGLVGLLIPFIFIKQFNSFQYRLKSNVNVRLFLTLG